MIAAKQFTHEEGHATVSLRAPTGTLATAITITIIPTQNRPHHTHLVGLTIPICYVLFMSACSFKVHQMILVLLSGCQHSSVALLATAAEIRPPT